MRFISCHIAGFGKFVNRSFDLSQNIVLIKAENGWGKTTLAAFLESMLFGLDNGRSKAVSANDRIKYEPWTGGVFGGSLVFSYAGKTYRIERTFGKTLAQDTAKIYDSNRMLCYDFGEKAERLGERIFGMDKESYQKSAYIPQGGVETGSLPDTLKNRLLTLLSAQKTENGELGAVERLENAERALRAKRKPAKGKLDELDERLEYLARQKIEAQKSAQEASETELLLRAQSRRIAETGQRLEQAFADIKRCVREWERSENLASRADAEKKLQDLNAFFGAASPATVNADGLQNAVNEFYALQTELAGLETKTREQAAKLQEKESVKAQLLAAQKTLDSFTLLLQANEQTREAGKRSTKEKKKKRRKIFDFSLIGVILFLGLSLFGAAKASENPWLGFSLLALGAAGLCVCFVALLKRAGAAKKVSLDFEDETLSASYRAAQADYKIWKEKLALFPPETEAEYEQSVAMLSAKKQRQNALETGIRNFLQNFRFGEIYDYRAALQTLKDNITAHETLSKTLQETDDTPTQADGENNVGGERLGLEDLERRRAGLEAEKERLTAERAKTAARLEEIERRAALFGEYEAEESLLFEEKRRLEKRYEAIKTAKEILLRARENVATRYLTPVEKNCRRYAEILGLKTGTELLHFAADGAPVFEVNGNFRSVEYYSEGIKDLLGFCTRLALAEALFVGEPPVLILDDPFTELDDEKTEKAKQLVKQLSAKYQIVYFTCKSERALS